MIRKLELRDIRPRQDSDRVLKKVREFLDSCDPDSSIDLTLELPE